MSDPTDPALALAADAANWKPIQGYLIPSRSRPGLNYFVTAASCSCKSFAVSGFQTCIHIQAVGLLTRVVPDPCADLVLERLPDGSFAWLRPAF